MRIAVASSLVALAATATGLIVTSPKLGEKVDFSHPITIKWQSVSTDPPTFDIALVNENVYPPTNIIVASGVDSDKGSYTVKADDKDLSGTDTGGGYQVNLLVPGGRILAQSQQFKVTGPKAASASSSVSTSTGTSTTAKHTKSTMTSTATATSTSNAAGALLAPNQAGSLLLGLVALAL